MFSRRSGKSGTGRLTYNKERTQLDEGHGSNDKSPAQTNKSPRDLVVGGWQEPDELTPNKRSGQRLTRVASKKQFWTCGRHKTLKPVSKVAGSEGRELWIAKQRTSEERGRIKAIVLTMEFLEKYKAAVPSHVIEEAELDWRWRVYVGAVNVLFHIERSHPAPEDVHLEDAKGSHTGWFISAVAVARATGLQAESLQDTWTRLMASS